MRLKLSLPAVQSDVEAAPSACPYCGGRSLQRRQRTAKAVRDPQVEIVVARRYVCRHCGRTFRVYPSGVSQSHTSKRLQGVAAVLYLMGLSYGATAQVLDALGHRLSKTTVYYAVRDLGGQAAALRRRSVRLPRGEAVAAPTDRGTAVRCEGWMLTVEVSVDPVMGLALTTEIRDERNAPLLCAWLHELAALVGGEVHCVGATAEPAHTSSPETAPA